jgi:hypothetical protein
MNPLHKLLDKVLPFYFPKSRMFTKQFHLAIYNQGKRPQTFLQALRDTRIVFKKNHKTIFVIKKGEY